MRRTALLLFSIFVACCFPQTSTLNVLSAPQRPAAAPIATVSVARSVGPPAQAAPLCHTCFFENAGIIPGKKLVPYYLSLLDSKDPLISGDARFIIWRATGNKDCAALDNYRSVRGPAERRLTANANIAFSAWECNQSGSDALVHASKLASVLGRNSEARILNQIAIGNFRPKFAETPIETSVIVPPNAKTMVLGESTIFLTRGMRVGTQVERVYRDWLGEEFDGKDLFKWDVTGNPAALPIARDDANRAHHEGALVEEIQKRVDVNVKPLFGTLIASDGEKWFGPDDQGVFRFEILDDKVQYPTTHTYENVGWITDTHGISAIVSQAIEYKSQLVIGCGDYEGKVKAAYYLAQRGINVVFPGDRFESMLIGYKGQGVLMGTAPVHKMEGTRRRGSAFVIGHQPVRFALSDVIVAEDTDGRYPIQYYDAAARYFRQLSKFVPLKVKYVKVDDENQISKVLDAADSVVAVRVRTAEDDAMLRGWLLRSPENRAVLFHSGLYPWAQALFTDFPAQVTFGDLHPRFE
jgi:hypothetical protein